MKKGGTLRLYGTLSGSEATVKIRDIMAGAPPAACCLLLQLPSTAGILASRHSGCVRPRVKSRSSVSTPSHSQHACVPAAWRAFIPHVMRVSDCREAPGRVHHLQVSFSISRTSRCFHTGCPKAASSVTARAWGWQATRSRRSGTHCHEHFRSAAKGPVAAAAGCRGWARRRAGSGRRRHCSC